MDVQRTPRRGMPAPAAVRRATARAAAALLCCAGLALGGCSGGATPFGGSGLTDIDKAFLAAAPSWDVDRDGMVTCQDWASYLSALFQAADKNRDGLLLPEEFQTIVATDRMFATADFRYWDAGKQGRLSLADMSARPNPAFTLVDKDRDCRLDKLEILAAETAGDRPRPSHRMPDARGGDPRGGGAGG